MKWKKEVPISQVDALFANGRYPIEFLFYYRDPIPMGAVRKALRSLARDFWPAFGEYEHGAICFDRYREEDCFDEESVDAGLQVPETTEGGPEVMARFGGKGRNRLFFLKAIRFKNGTALIPKLEHVAGDGTSYFTFLSVLAAISRPSRLPFRTSFIKSMFKPHHRRTALKAFSFQGQNMEPDGPVGRLAMDVQEIPREEVRSLIAEAASSRHIRLSSNDILSAMVVKKLVLLHRGRWDRMFSLTIPIDVRSKVHEYGRRFFGNGIMLHKLGLEKELVENAPLLDVAAKIRRAMPVVSRETYVRYLEGLERTIAEKAWDRFRPFDPKSGCLVTNLSKLPVEKLDFGTGYPEAIIPLTVEENSAGILAGEGTYVLRSAF